jgi:hypothetical protein
MSKKTSVTLYDNGQIVGLYPDAVDIKYPFGDVKVLTFKIREKSLSTRGREHDRVITRTLTTTLRAVVEETVEHSGLISV